MVGMGNEVKRIVTVVVICAAAWLAAGGSWAQPRADWPQVGGGPGHTHAVRSELTVPMPLSWKHYTGYSEGNTASPVVGGDRVFFAAAEVQQGRYVYHLYCVDRDNGALIWKFESRVTTKDRDTGAVTSKPDPIVAGPAYRSGIVYFGTEGGTFYALDAAAVEEGGAGKWSVTVPRSIRGAPTVVADRVIFGSSDKRVYALDPKSGEQAWSVPVAGDVTAAVAVADDTAFVPCSNGEVFALALHDGRTRWRRSVALGRLEIDLVVGGDRLYVASSSAIRALALRNGALRWSRRTSGRIAAAPAVTDEAVYVGCTDGAVYALKPTDGSVIWRQTLDHPVSGPPLAAENAVLIGTRGPFLFALETDSGEPLWQYRGWPPVASAAGSRYQISGGPATAQGALYVLSTDGNLYAFSPKSVDQRGPAMIAISPQEGETIRGWPPITLRVNVFDEGSGLDHSSISATLDGNAQEYYFDSATGICTIELKAGDGPVEPLRDGPHTLTISAKDALGNAGEHSLVFYTKQAL
jgi:outer membrane protein assembly factor BamB